MSDTDPDGAKPKSVLATCRKMLSHLTPRRRRQLKLLPLPVLCAALAEMVSVGAIIPFLGALVSPETIFELDGVAWLAGQLGIETAAGLRLPLTVLFCVAILVASGFRLLLIWINAKLAFGAAHDIGVELYRHHIYQPYRVQIARNSSHLLGGIAKARMIAISLNALLSVTSASFIALFIVAALLLVDTGIAIMSFLGFGLIYLLVTTVTRGRLNRMGSAVAEAQTSRFKALQDGVGGVRDILLDGLQPFFLRMFRTVDWQMTRAQGGVYFLSNSPRQIIEPIGIILIVFIAYGLNSRPGEFSQTVPLLGALALGAQRLLPVLQQIYNGWATLRSNQASLADVAEFLDQPVAEELVAARPAPLRFEKTIEFRGVWFRYSEDSPYVLRGINLTINKGQRIGFLGATGSGKSTVFDLLMGLLTPTEGEILVDGEPITGARRLAWQEAIAHVPQAIYLADATIAENIAFGIPLKDIDMDRVRDAARQAQIADFIERSKDGYLATIGERGVRLSGGQRQRVGIARALYKRATVLVFDEATSALDNETERSVMEAIEGLSGEFTIFLIAHRVTTLGNCDVVVKIENGEIIAEGSYESVLESSHRMSAAE